MARVATVCAGGALAAIAVAAVALSSAPAPHTACDEPGPGAALTRAGDRFAAATSATPPVLARYWRDEIAAYQRGWTELRTQACAEPRATEADARVRCLDGYADEVAALLEIFAALDEPRRRAAMQLVLVAPRECLTPAAPALAALRRRDPVVWRARAALVEAAGAARLDPLVAGPRVAAARQAVAEAAFPPLAFELTAVDVMLGQSDEAQLRDLATAAERAGHWPIAIRTWMSLLTRVLYDEPGRARARDVLALADGALTHGGDPVRERAMWHVVRVRLLPEAEQLATLERARKLVVDAGIPVDVYLLAALAAAYIRIGRMDLARPATEQALAIARAGGTNRALPIELSTNLAVGILRDSPREARELLEPLLAQVDHRQRLPELVLASTIDQIATSYAVEGRPAEALAVLDEWQPAIDATLDPSSYDAAPRTRAAILIDLRRDAEAENQVRRALEIYVATIGPDELETIELRMWRGQVLVRLGEYRQARDELARALASFTRLAPGDDRIPTARLYLALALHGAGRDGEARPEAEAALAAYRTLHPPEDVGFAAWALAQVIAATAPARARTLIDEAIAAWERDAARWTVDLAAARKLRARLGR